MENIIQKHRAFVAGQIEKSFDSNLQSPAQEVEKAYSVGDEKDFNGRTYYVHELNAAGQPKWRLKDKKTKADNEKKFKENFKDASDEVLQKIVEGKIQSSDHEKKWATDIINERKKAGKSDAAAKKIIDLLTISNSKYTDIKKVVAFKTDKGNWAIDYDGANTGLILNGAKLSERELKAAGVKIEKPANDPRDKVAKNTGLKKYYDEDSNETWYEGKVSGKRVRILQETVGKTDWWNVEIDGKFIKNSDGNAMTFQTPKEALDEIEETQSRNKKADSKQDKIAQNAGFKDYEEMRGYQNYVTAKNLLKKRSMQASTKAAHRNELEKQITDYEKDHKDVIDRIKNKKK